MGHCGYKLCDQSSKIPFLLGGGKAHWTFQMDYSGWLTVGKQQINELRMELRYLDHWAFSVSHSICGGGCGGFAIEKYAVGKLVTKVKIRTNRMYKLLARVVYGWALRRHLYRHTNGHSIYDIHTHIYAWTGTRTHTHAHARPWSCEHRPTLSFALRKLAPKGFQYFYQQRQSSSRRRQK